MPGGRLTDEDRQHIAAGLAEGLGYAEIGRRLGRPASTVMREVTRNGGPDDYGAERAHEATRHRARRHKRARPPAPPIPDGGHGRDPQAVQDFTESFIALLVQQGLPRMEARVLACLYVTDSGTLTAADLVQRLHVSPASISHAVAFLEQQGMLRRERVPGARRERYVIDDEIWLRSILASLRMNEALAAASQRGADILGAATLAGARFESSAELLSLVSAAFRQVVEQWQGRSARRSVHPPGD
ncbi:GbsR/MarR family transcriptional regulator [Microbispora bryophytorum]|uniref:MarR family transcriptional regulator n=1 Tax=Microbispora bryophytorum TaxID=1460882 RepID=A0A8H9H9J2_9ACTN|nr:helix-turn-helix domain-containing protein [Microbispora bryophytorum]MBD3139724.1 helix-turn-helix domain-containing protein [Microbispora bryophytorum]TQS02719.1 helix-turn-helix domain-containing protein [Microbispora bryophytorum]GGO27638.1 MarR family transcriptional regulator [Microbispora bryophytorum]